MVAFAGATLPRGPPPPPGYRKGEPEPLLLMPAERSPLRSPFLFASARAWCLPVSSEMYLHLPPLSPIHFSSRKAPSPAACKALALLFHTFEDSLVGYLKSLIPAPGGAGEAPAVSFSSLSRAVGVLSSVHALSDALISDPSLSGSDEAALASYVASSIKLLDVCNAVSAEIERLHRGRLLLLFASHLLSSAAPPPPENIRKARECIREWEEGSSPRRGISAAAVDLIRDLARREAPPRGKATALRRAIYAVEAVSALVAGALVASLGAEVDLAAGAKAPGEFAWGEAFNNLRIALSSGICGRCPGEAKGLEASVRDLWEAMDAADGTEEEKAERLRIAVAEVERATEGLTEGLDRLGSSVNGLFRAVLAVRNAAIQSFRLRPNKCK